MFKSRNGGIKVDLQAARAFFNRYNVVLIFKTFIKQPQTIDVEHDGLYFKYQLLVTIQISAWSVSYVQLLVSTPTTSYNVW